ncbi:MAG: hypothetical protein ACK6CE_19330, partial [Planctomycetota bacterium]
SSPADAISSGGCGLRRPPNNAMQRTRNRIRRSGLSRDREPLIAIVRREETWGKPRCALGHKRINSAIHNFAHSFVSLMNYVDGEYIIDLLPKLLRETPGHEIRFSLLDGTISPQRGFHPAFMKSIGYYRNRVASHLESENVALDIVRSFEFILFADINGPICRAEAIDDRGVVHTESVGPC